MVSGNPSKAVTGTGLGLEFDNIATMSATKVDISSNATLLSLNVTGSTIPTNGIYSPAVNQLGFATNSTQRGLISSVGGWTVNAPSSGAALTVNTASSTGGLTVTGAGNSSVRALIVGASKGVRIGDSSAQATIDGVDQTGSGSYQPLVITGSTLGLGIAGTSVISIAAAGNVTIAAPSSGVGLTVSGGGVTVNAPSGNAAIATPTAGYTFGNSTDNPTYAFTGTGAISGVGSGLTSLNATNLSSGTVADGRLSANVPLLNAANTFTLANVFNISARTAHSMAAGAQTFGNSTDNPTYTFAGTGATTFNGTVTGLSFIPTSATAPTNGLYLAAANTVGFAANSVSIARMTSTAITGLGPVAGAQVDMTPDKGTFTCTYTGGSTSPTGTATWSRVGNLVTLSIPNLSATSNATSWTYTGLPAAIQPASLAQIVYSASTGVVDNGALTAYAISLAAGSGTITFQKSNGTTYSATVWTASGTKGFSNTTQITFSYLLN